MALMPRGEPRSVPDPDGDAYDWAMAEERAQRNAMEFGTNQTYGGSAARREAYDALSATPGNPEGAKPFPLVGPIVEMFEDASSGKPWHAVMDAANAAVDGLMFATGAEVLAAAKKGVANNVGRMTAEAVRKQLRRRGVAGAGQEIHHTFELNGIKRTAENWRNHPAFLKVLTKANHRRLHGAWDGKPKYDPVRRLWIGTPDWIKSVPAWGGDQATEAAVNMAKADVASREEPQSAPPRTTSPQPAPATPAGRFTVNYAGAGRGRTPVGP